jgi:hypothetical protein
VSSAVTTAYKHHTYWDLQDPFLLTTKQSGTSSYAPNAFYLVALHWPMTMVSELLLSSSSPAGFQMLLTSSSSSSVLCKELFKFSPCISNDLTWHNARA